MPAASRIFQIASLDNLECCVKPLRSGQPCKPQADKFFNGAVDKGFWCLIIGALAGAMARTTYWFRRCHAEQHCLTNTGRHYFVRTIAPEAQDLNDSRSSSYFEVEVNLWECEYRDGSSCRYRPLPLGLVASPFLPARPLLRQFAARSEGSFAYFQSPCRN
jgi:hypothetical protein